MGTPRFTWLILSVITSLGASGCMPKDITATKDDAKAPNSVLLSGSVCGANAFRLIIQPQLRVNCGSCHGSSHGSADLSVAYATARSKVVFNTPSVSQLVNRSGEAHYTCAVCGAAWGSTLASLIDQWGKAEGGDVQLCTEYAGASGDTAAGVFSLGAYVPPDPAQTVVSADALAVFQAVPGVHQTLRQNCAQCHVTGGLASLAPFAVDDALLSYKEAKPRMNFSLLDSSMILARANIPNHGGGCMNCGDAVFVQTLKSQLAAWAAKEATAADEFRMVLSLKNIPSPLTLGSATTQTITWNLGTEATRASDGRTVAALAGASFSIQVRKSSTSATTYRFSNPTVTTSNSAIQVQNISFIINGAAATYLSTYSSVSETVPANTASGMSLSAAAALAPIVNVSTDQIGFSIKVLKVP